MVRRLGGTVALCGMLLASSPAHADERCGEDGPTNVALGGGIGAAAGLATSLASSGIISLSDDTRDYDFAIGAGVGIGVTVGLAALYWVVDASTGCTQAQDGIAWAVPITTALIGTALPIAIWGAADELPPPTGDTSAMLRSSTPTPTALSLSVRF